MAIFSSCNRNDGQNMKSILSFFLFPLKRCMSFMAEGKSCVGRGYVAVRVGVEQTKFVIAVSYINHPLFAQLLEDAEEVFGFEQQGSLRIPCTVQEFLATIRAIHVKSCT